jgi:selenocysteine lyase/cysteine desulfurase
VVSFFLKKKRPSLTPANELQSATRSDFHIAAARKAVLEYFDAPVDDYVCIFTANATTALKLVGESFPFRSGSSLIIPADCHNSVNGLRRFAEDAGAKVEYLESTQYGGFDEEDAIVCSIPLSSKVYVNSLLTCGTRKR